MFCRHSSPLQSNQLNCSCFSSSSLCTAQTAGEPKDTYTHSHLIRTTHLPPVQQTRFSFSGFFVCPLLSGLSFLLSHYLCLLLPSFFQYPLSFSQQHMQSASLRSPHLCDSPSIPLPFMQSLPPSPLLSLFSVSRARGHYLSHSGHVRWNGGVYSEQKQTELRDSHR